MGNEDLLERFESGLPDLGAIRAAERHIRSLLTETPTVCARDLGASLAMPSLFLKAENLQPTGSFKPRGVLNWMGTASRTELDCGLVTVSAGNHALALAWAAAPHGIPVTVVMPEGSSPLKVAATRDLGAKVLLESDIQQAVARCQQLVSEQGLTLVHPYNDPRVMAGQGTVGLEVLQQQPGVERVLCPVGGGGLISGIGLALKALKPDVELIGVEPEGAATMRHAWDCADPSASLSRINTIAASLAPAMVGGYSYVASRRVVDDIVTVSDAAILEAVRLTISRARLYVETGAVVGIAALLEDRVRRDRRNTVVVVTGGNMDLAEAAQILSTRQ